MQPEPYTPRDDLVRQLCQLASPRPAADFEAWLLRSDLSVEEVRRKLLLHVDEARAAQAADHTTTDLATLAASVWAQRGQPN